MPLQMSGMPSFSKVCGGNGSVLRRRRRRRPCGCRYSDMQSEAVWTSQTELTQTSGVSTLPGRDARISPQNVQEAAGGPSWMTTGSMGTTLEVLSNFTTILSVANYINNVREMWVQNSEPLLLAVLFQIVLFRTTWLMRRNPRQSKHPVSAFV